LFVVFVFVHQKILGFDRAICYQSGELPAFCGVFLKDYAHFGLFAERFLLIAHCMKRIRRGLGLKGETTGVWSESLQKLTSAKV
jgi:hypothetical protein